MDPRGIRMSAPWRERAKHAIPQIVHLARFGRLMANQVRYPIVGTYLDWAARSSAARSAAYAIQGAALGTTSR